ncbi:ParB/RepB/Spo0J family partition protein [Xenorhabdus sp. KK7.4]|uniref:ParB/RepB/Spo0J family partition protein n=1 Tax=Xenorhabdus sp. KK7.4 TaxID=1851572 RepID=UPI000C040209|nr:ParB/RepB/Spo0J family partition protein [Xenorhabdus sp. KK7.4]PHM51254.1 chromosome partition protein B [Xenorhabdus sp. KK7.4]
MNKTGLDLSGLDSFSALMSGSTLEVNTQPEGHAGYLIKISLDKIHKDPNNARKNIDQDELKNLAESMMSINPITGKPRGNKNPVSLRNHPEISGEYILNAGERRCAAAKLAGLSEVLALIDDDADEFDNAVDNIQREPLSPLETASFIQRQIEKGDKKSAIAARLGKTASFVSDHLIFFEMDNSIRDLYDSGLVTSMQAMTLLHRAYKKYPGEVEEFCIDIKNEITTAEVKTFCDSLKNSDEFDLKSVLPPKKENKQVITETDISIEEDTKQDNINVKEEERQLLKINGEPISGEIAPNEQKAVDFLLTEEKEGKIKKAIIQIQYGDRAARLLVNRRTSYGLGWVKYDDDGIEEEVDLNDIKLIAVMEG